VLLGLADVEEG
jgi:hypothetical protein